MYVVLYSFHLAGTTGTIHDGFLPSDVSKSNQVPRHSAPKQLPDGNARTLHEVQKDQAGVAGLVFIHMGFLFL